MELYQNYADTEWPVTEKPSNESLDSEHQAPVVADMPIVDKYEIPVTDKGMPNIFKFTTDLVLQITRQFWWISIFMITTTTIDHHFVHYQNKMMMYGLLALISITAILLPNNMDFTKI